MIRRANQPKHGAPPADLLVCFPSRAHLTLLPKKLSSPARLMEPSFHHRRQYSNQLKKLPSTRLGQTSSPADLWDKAKRGGSDESEPSSPKVTCAGQIKVRHRSAAANCKSWQSVMEEIERVHKKSKNEKKRTSWGDALGIKKEVMQFLTCLGNIKLDFRCFGAVPECDLSSDEDDNEEDEEEADHSKKNINLSSDSDCKEEIKISKKDSKTVFSDWFMVLQDVADSEKEANAEADTSAAPPPPPPNALLLMRCRSAPAKSWLENRAKVIVEEEEERDRMEAHSSHHQQQDDEEEEDEGEEEEEVVDTEKISNGGRKKLRDYLLVMDQYDKEFYKLSSDIAKETWVVGSIKPFPRSRSWKR